MNEIEATRAKLKCLEMVEGTGLDWWKCIKHQGYILGGYPTVLVADKEEYEFALGIVEGKPVWAGDELYWTGGRPSKEVADSGHNLKLSEWSWNPPKPKTVIVELPISESWSCKMTTDLERVTARAVECGIYGANKTLLNAAPRVLLAFERATLKEANETIERLKKFELTSPSVEALQKELADTKEKYDINEASNKAVELALEDVPYKGSYADGIEYLKEQIEQLQREKAMLVDAAEAVIARWDTPLWKDAPATAIFINELRNELQEIDLNDPRR